MRSRFLLQIFILAAIVALTVGGLSLANPQEKPIYKPTGGEATIVGTISFDGTPPKPLRIDTSADPVCTTLNPDLTTEWVVVTDRKLANVVVYVQGETLNQYSFETPSEGVTLEHKGCRFVPHLLGLQTRQRLWVLNSDETTHNTHATPRHNRDSNYSQSPGAAVVTQQFDLPEVSIPFKDNQHPWEKAYVSVFSHPFFSITGTDGSYKLSGLPSGQYTVVAWHEKLGEQTVEVSIAGSEQKTLDFTFKASDH